MAQVVRNARDGRWHARWRDPSGRQRKKSFVRRIDAQRWLDQLLAEMHRGQYVDPATSRVKLGVLLDQWSGGLIDRKESTAARYRGIVSKYVEPAWGDWPLGAIGGQDIQAWVDGLSRSGLAPSSVRQTYGVLAQVLKAAAQNGQIGRDPAVGIRLPRLVKSEHKYLDVDQVARLAVAASPRDLEILVLAFSGLRFGELAALRARRVDLVHGRLRIEESVSLVHGRLTWTTPKSHQSRSVPLPRRLVDRLAARMESMEPDDLVFTAPMGGALRLNHWREYVFDPAVQQAGLQRITPHDLRHTAASLAISSGANVKAVQQMLGHASAAMTLDVYAGLFAQDLDGISEALNKHVPQMCHVDGTAIRDE